MSEWQPIESAPKDGTPFLAYYPEGKLDDECEAYVPVIAIVQTDERGDLSQLQGNTYFVTPQGAPTHWQPLPEGPK